jgi:hypothetical protein
VVCRNRDIVILFAAFCLAFLFTFGVIVKPQAREVPTPDLPTEAAPPNPSPQQPLAPTTPVKPKPQIATINWQLYQDKDRGFSFLYPSGYFLKSPNEENLLFKISDRADFENNQFAFVINGRLLNNYQPSAINPLSTPSSQLTISSAGFLGNPPYQYYQIVFPLKKGFLGVSAQIHHENEDRDTAVFNTILSTFKVQPR